MSRKRLDHEVNKLIDKLSSPSDVREKSLARYQEANKKGTFARKCTEYIESLGSDQRREIFGSIYEFFYDACEKEHLAGDNKALMKCIDFCCTNKLVIPNWAAEAFHQGYTKISNYEARSWDVVFGQPHKGKHLKAQRCDEYKHSIYKYVKERIGQGHSTDQELFCLTAKRFGSNAKEISDIYYDLERQRVKWLYSHYEGMDISYKALKQLRQNKP